MPPVRSVSCVDDLITIVDAVGVKALAKAQLPGAQNTVGKAETWVNTWLATNLVGYQARVHVFSLTPLRVSIGTWDAGLTIDSNWWA